MAQGEGEILVEEVAQKLGHPQVGPTSVHEKQSLKVPELGDAVIRCQDSLNKLKKRAIAIKENYKKKNQMMRCDLYLHSFLTADTDSDVSRFDH